MATMTAIVLPSMTLTPKQVAEELQISLGSVYFLLASEELKGIKVMGKWRAPRPRSKSSSARDPLATPNPP